MVLIGPVVIVAALMVIAVPRIIRRQMQLPDVGSPGQGPWPGAAAR
jgi:hypothetical protein